MRNRLAFAAAVVYLATMAVMSVSVGRLGWVVLPEAVLLPLPALIYALRRPPWRRGLAAGLLGLTAAAAAVFPMLGGFYDDITPVATLALFGLLGETAALALVSLSRRT